MNPLQNALLGFSFWLLSFFQIVIMAWMWKYNDKSKHTGADHQDDTDPWQTTLRKWVITHRVLGILYVVIYIILMTQMIPRMWSYQVELPARTVFHLTLGLSIGIILISKVVIIRFFQHLGHYLPVMGYVLFFFTTLLLSVSIPFAYQEQRMIQSTRAFSEENIQRVQELLPKAGYTEDVSHDLVNLDVLKAGREVLLQKCIQCHDLRTILAKPRTPKGWADLVERMASKPIIGMPITVDEVDWATVYLVGITPDLQTSVKSKRRTSKSNLRIPVKADPGNGTIQKLDFATAAAQYEDICSQCHELDEVDYYGGDTEEGWREVVIRMVEENELFEEAEVLEEIIQYLAVSKPL